MQPIRLRIRGCVQNILLRGAGVGRQLDAEGILGRVDRIVGRVGRMRRRPAGVNRGYALRRLARGVVEYGFRWERVVLSG